MKKCLQCEREFEPKRPHGKFCSDKCRVAYNRAHPSNAVTKRQIQALYNEMLELAKQMQGPVPTSLVNPRSPKHAVALYNAEHPEQFTQVENLTFNDLKILISNSTSSLELQAAWKQVEKNEHLPSWQLKVLQQLKINQQTQIDF